jgi:hypothetical protein
MSGNYSRINCGIPPKIWLKQTKVLVKIEKMFVIQALFPVLNDILSLQ